MWHARRASPGRCAPRGAVQVSREVRALLGSLGGAAVLEAALRLRRPVSRRVLIVGGVAGGASAAARLRRLDETAEIVLYDRGPYVSFANCGLPYYVGNVISDERQLLVASRETFRARFNIDVRCGHEALRIDRAAKSLRVRDLGSGEERDEPY